MARKCSHCGNEGHNSRTCSNSRSLKLFGVQILIASSPMKKNCSMDCLSPSYLSSSSSSPSRSSASLVSSNENSEQLTNGYLSDDLMEQAQERKKGVPWTEEEHGKFLAGLKMLGKGDWRGISRNYVTTRTPTQVASHAQKYFLRQSNLNNTKRRSSRFDVAGNCEAQVHVIDGMPKIKDSSSSSDFRFPLLSLNVTSNGVGNDEIDLNVSQSSSLVEKHHSHLPSPDLELAIY
ncbi:uncharacterized protein A4U43_C01F20800 [Asparagus officinalis]|uniref:Uncharacterized protein n=1 Tax=Asparagus officinalis TaxID=4686 RepID=A0A5P1FVD5_ASPOF|nr:probable transcription factor At5g61620 [Asparagus officinalis]ONK80701.1 uncharacterized protein A4U43_C01F20800 [Asparagus officinalis]